MESQAEMVSSARIVERSAQNAEVGLAKAVERPIGLHESIREIDTTTLRLEQLLARITGAEIPEAEAVPYPSPNLANLLENGQQQIYGRLQSQWKLIAEIEAILFG